ncbi:MAG: hypothetical protein WD227_08780 [Vicinamibacterales bacterium]
MESDRRFARARHALNDQDSIGLVPDDGVLVALNRGDDVLHPLVGRAAQLLLQHVVYDVEDLFDVIHVGSALP